MREELNEIKALVLLYKDKKSELEQSKVDFINSVEGTNFGSVVLELVDIEVFNVYDLSTRFYDEYEYVWGLAKDLKKAHPRYQEAHFKSALAEMIVNHNEWEETDYSKAIEVADAYMLFEGNGYSDIHDLEIEVYSLGEKIHSNSNEVLDQTVEKVTDFGKKVTDGVANVLRPYGEVAKGQYAEASSKAKAKAQSVANKGVKSLRKVLDNFEAKINK